ncbi:hypothetical protein [Bacteroides uniformis]|uniref:hypothetical protein n=1 Tax=Bacteroides uniformis TaxID=820 RepID=UPI00189A443D|nr:hypothetical protein [Bacteroides uniformis]MDC1998135.1 hypothetical protein [Bacteroides uniformis]MDC2001899.1 hypothetical protein [Bacteroides uniformis]MDC2005630.1 hypothetical protein [Bacteroides uniformis]
MKNANNFFKNAIKWTLIVLLSLAAFNWGASIWKGPLVEKHISYRNNVEQITNINQLELSDPTKQVINTEITYNYDGIIYFLGMIICLILVFLILSPLKYEYHEFIHDEWREEFNRDIEECKRKIDELNQRINNSSQETTK